MIPIIKVGDRVGSRVAVSRENSSNGHSVWVVQCDCGDRRAVRAYTFTGKNSCIKCLNKEAEVKREPKKGMPIGPLERLGTFSGNPCLRSHSGLRYVSNGDCVKCSKLRQGSGKRTRHREERYRANAKYLSVPENLCGHRALCQNRRSKARSADGVHTKHDILRLFDSQAGKCAYCRVSLKSGYEVDHIEPLARGGSNWPSNLQLTCEGCNRRKSAKDPMVFAREVGMLL